MEGIFVGFRSSKANIFKDYSRTQEGSEVYSRIFEEISENEPQSSKYDLNT